MVNAKALRESSRSNPTLITGCWFSIPAEDKAAYGDLWMVGDCFVLNAVVDIVGSPWEHNLDLGARSDKVIILREGHPYFERRGVIVCDALHCFANPAAQQHFKELLAL